MSERQSRTTTEIRERKSLDQLFPVIYYYFPDEHGPNTKVSSIPEHGFWILDEEEVPFKEFKLTEHHVLCSSMKIYQQIRECIGDTPTIEGLAVARRKLFEESVPETEKR